MAGRSISALIKLEGAEGIRKALEDIGATGSKAFDQIKSATDGANKTLENVSKAVSSTQAEFAKIAEAGKKAGEAFKDFGSALGSTVAKAGAIVGVFTGAAASMIALAKSAANASDQLVRNAQATGLSVQEYAGFSRAARQAGIENEQFVAGMRKFSGDVVESAKKEKEAILAIATEVAKVTNKQEEGVFKVQKVADLQQQLDAIKKVAPEVQQALANVGQNLPVERVTFELQKLIRSGVDLSEFFAKLGVPLPATNVLDGLKAAAREGDTALAKLKVRTTEFVNGVLTIRSSNAVLLDAAEAFSKLAEGPAKVAVAAELLGRAGPQFANFLNLGKVGLQEMINKFDQFGLRLTDAEIAIGQKMNRSLERLSGTISGVKNKIGALFEPIILEAADAFTQKILENSGAVRAFAERVRDFAVPVVRDFVLLLSGKDNEVQNKFLITARDRIIEFGNAVKGAVLDIIIPAFGALMKVLDTVARGINAIFGTTLTGGQIGIAIVVAQLIGAFSLLGNGVLLVVAALKLFGSAFGIIRTLGALLLALVGWPALIVAGLVAAGVAIVVFWDDIKKGAQATWDFIKGVFSGQNAGAVWSWLSTQFSAEMKKIEGDVTRELAIIKGLFDVQEGDSVWGWLTRQLDKELARIKSDIANLVGDINKLFNRLPTSGGEIGNPAGDPTGFAGGGFVRGPGTATSDSILARLSDGEFVQRAAAVRHYGPQFMAALNALRIPRNLLRGFNAGGLVEGLSHSLSGMAMPRFAAGGLATSGPSRDLGTLTVRDERTGETFSGLADEAFAEGLARVVNRRRRHSGGRKPSSYGA